jgi:hypothetical protein
MLQDKDYDVMDKDEEYKYLVKMPMDSVSQENVEKINTEHSNKSQELDLLKDTTIQQMWLQELDELLKAYLSYQEARLQAQLGLD